MISAGTRLGPAHVNLVLNWFEEVKRRVPGAR